jgi:hypothetical protein
MTRVLNAAKNAKDTAIAGLVTEAKTSDNRACVGRGQEWGMLPLARLRVGKPRRSRSLARIL